MVDAAVIFSFHPNYTNPNQLSYAEYDNRIRRYTSQIARIPTVVWQEGKVGDLNLLETLDPAVNSIPYLYVLVNQLRIMVNTASPAFTIHDDCRPGGEIWSKLSNYLDAFDPVQVRYVGSDWRRAVEYAGTISRLANTPTAGLVPIRNAMRRLDPSLGTFTSLHLLYLRLCHEARAFYEALPVLDHYIHNFPSQPAASVESALPCADYLTGAGYITVNSGLSDRITAADVQEYLLLGANVYLALRQYQQAQLWLEYILGTPAQSVASGLMVEAYRKRILVGCLVESDLTNSLKAANISATGTMRMASKAYHTIADVFQGGDCHQLQAEIDAGARIWEQDGNVGLVEEVRAYHTKLYVKNLHRTYAAVRVSTIAEWLGQVPDTTNVYLRTLIKEGFLNATVHQNVEADPILQFQPELASRLRTNAEKQQLVQLMTQVRMTEELAEHVRVAALRLSVSQEYIHHTKRKAHQKDEGRQDLGKPMDIWDAHGQNDQIIGDF